MRKIITGTFDNEYVRYLGVILLSLITAYILIECGSDMKRLGLFLLSPLALFIMIKPIYGLFFCLLLDLWFSYVDVFMVPARNYLILYVTILMTANILYRKKLEMSEELKGIISIFLVFIVWVMVINFINGVPHGRSLYIISGKFAAALLILLCTSFFITNEYKLKMFLYTAVFGASISAFVGVMQFFDWDLFWQFRYIMPVSSHDSPISLQILSRKRISGLAFYAIPLSYQLGSLIPLTFSIIVNKAGSVRDGNYLIIPMAIMILALFLSLTRSAITGCIVGMVIVLYLGKTRQIKVLSVLSLVIISMFVIFYVDILKERAFSAIGGAHSRIALALAALMIFVNNPIGIGAGEFHTHAIKYYSKLYHLQGAGRVFETGIHNQFLGTLVYYGLPGFIMLLILYKCIFRYLNRLRRNSNDPFVKAFSIGLIGTFASYIINSFLHNAGPFIGDPFNWYFIGMVIVLSNLKKSVGREPLK
ncbi:MAG: O-antigen ligase family protein [Desulfobacterales bacterium]|nr:O-antigen ligase family protein [Desulfobacterales bacterium]